MTPPDVEVVAAEVSYVISVAIERQQQAGGIDAVAYGLLRDAQTRLEQLSSDEARRRVTRPREEIR
jgi:hypothetical protein